VSPCAYSLTRFSAKASYTVGRFPYFARRPGGTPLIENRDVGPLFHGPVTLGRAFFRPADQACSRVILPSIKRPEQPQLRAQVSALAWSQSEHVVTVCVPFIWTAPALAGVTYGDPEERGIEASGGPTCPQRMMVCSGSFLDEMRWSYDLPVAPNKSPPICRLGLA
jgi:hypothetical protein